MIKISIEKFKTSRDQSEKHALSTQTAPFGRLRSSSLPFRTEKTDSTGKSAANHGPRSRSWAVTVVEAAGLLKGRDEQRTEGEQERRNSGRRKTGGTKAENSTQKNRVKNGKTNPKREPITVRRGRKTGGTKAETQPTNTESRAEKSTEQKAEPEPKQRKEKTKISR